MKPQRINRRVKRKTRIVEQVPPVELDLDRRARRLREMRSARRPAAGRTAVAVGTQVDQIRLTSGGVAVVISAPMGNINTHLTNTNRARHWIRGTDTGAFGVTPAGRPYYDTTGAASAEAAVLTYNPATGHFGLTTGD